MPETYNEDAVQQILRLAMNRQGQDVALPRSQLIEIAEDLGISEADLEAAEEEWQVQQEEQEARESFDAYRHQQLRQGIARFLIINGGLVLLNLVIDHRITWSVYPVLIWGMAIALQAWQTLKAEGEEYDRAFRRWRLRQQIGQSFKAISERFKIINPNSGTNSGDGDSSIESSSDGLAAAKSTPSILNSKIFNSKTNSLSPPSPSISPDTESPDTDISNVSNGVTTSKQANGLKSAAIANAASQSPQPQDQKSQAEIEAVTVDVNPVESIETPEKNLIESSSDLPEIETSSSHSAPPSATPDVEHE